MTCPRVCDFASTQYADDAVLTTSGKNLSQVKVSIKNELDKVVRRMTSNKLTLNYKKSKYMVFSDRNYDYNFTINLQNDEMERVNNFSYTLHGSYTEVTPVPYNFTSVIRKLHQTIS